MSSETKFCIWIVSPRGYIHQHCFNEIAIALHYAFRRLQIDAPIVGNFDRRFAQAITLGANLLASVDPTQLPQSLILYNLEQIDPDSAWYTESYINLLRRYPVWDYSPANIGALHELGIDDVGLCEIGYVPELSRIPATVEDIDVLFVGSINDRRRHILQALEKRGVRVVWLFGVYGQERDQYIARAKIVLNIHYYDAKIFEIVRVSYLLANRKCVVSEAGHDRQLEAPFAEGVVFADYEDIVETTLYYLEHVKARRTVAERGFNSFRRRSQLDYLKQVLGT